MEKLRYQRFLLVKDNFYSDIDFVYQKALNASYFQPEDVTGERSTTVFHPKGIKQKLEKILGIKITRWDTDPAEENGVFYHGLSKGKKKEIPGVHSDEPYNDITVLIYLTPDLPFDCGTTLWMHKQTKLTDPVTLSDAKKLKRKWSEIRDQLERETRQRSKWMAMDQVAYRQNRMVAYPSGAFHSATNHYGGTIQTGRLYQTFRIGVDWNTFRMNTAK